MRQIWMLALGTALVVSMSGCARDHDDQGGGGGNQMETHDRSNPVTREERTGQVLKDVPHDVAQPKEGVSNVKTKPLTNLKVNVNTASVDELTQVPGINLNLAKAIVDNRPYSDAKDLSAKVPGLAPNAVASFDEYLVFGGGGAGK